jgi:hypothetical protein
MGSGQDVPPALPSFRAATLLVRSGDGVRSGFVSAPTRRYPGTTALHAGVPQMPASSEARTSLSG